MTSKKCGLDGSFWEAEICDGQGGYVVPLANPELCVKKADAEEKKRLAALLLKKRAKRGRPPLDPKELKQRVKERNKRYYKTNHPKKAERLKKRRDKIYKCECGKTWTRKSPGYTNHVNFLYKPLKNCPVI